MSSRNSDELKTYVQFCYADAGRGVASEFELVTSVACPHAKAFVEVMEPLDGPLRRSLAASFVKRYYGEVDNDANDVPPQHKPFVERYRQLVLSHSGKTSEPIRRSPQPGRDLRKVLRQLLQERTVQLHAGPMEDARGQNFLMIHRTMRFILETHIDLGSSLAPVTYHHRVLSTGGEEILNFVSLLSWLGIASQTFWETVTISNADQTVQGLAKLVEHFALSFCGGWKE